MYNFLSIANIIDNHINMDYTSCRVFILTAKQIYRTGYLDNSPIVHLGKLTNVMDGTAVNKYLLENQPEILKVAISNKYKFYLSFSIYDFFSANY